MLHATVSVLTDNFTMTGVVLRAEPEESITQVIKQVSKGTHPGFITLGRRHQKSKIGASVASH